MPSVIPLTQINLVTGQHTRVMPEPKHEPLIAALRRFVPVVGHLEFMVPGRECLCRLTVDDRAATAVMSFYRVRPRSKLPVLTCTLAWKFKSADVAVQKFRAFLRLAYGSARVRPYRNLAEHVPILAHMEHLPPTEDESAWLDEYAQALAFAVLHGRRIDVATDPDN